MELSSSKPVSKESWWHYEGTVHFIVNITPFRLLLRARGRQVSHRELIAEIDYLEHDFIFSPGDLTEMFPIGSTLSLQLNASIPESGFVVASGEILQRNLQGHSLQLKIGFKRVDEDLEDLLAELGANGGRSMGPLH